ncbi:MAG: sugar ABC transporter permease [Treponema sp.]|nr:sugar ABC transporter permease [Treponema sp.]
MVLSLTDFNFITEPRFLGIANYRALFTTDRHFLNSLNVTLRYALFTVPAQLAFALFIAMVLSMKLKGINFYRTAFYIPSILGGNIAIAILWGFLFQSQGLINQGLTLFGMNPVGWFSTPGGAMAVLSTLRVWQFGSPMVIFLAALKAVPEELYESASIDGAGKIRSFFTITIPMITPTIFFNLVMQLVNAMQEFNSPFLITQGGPARSTYFTSMMIFDNAFMFFRMGYASAMSWVLFVIIVVFTALLFGTARNWVYYADEGGGGDRKNQKPTKI